MSPEERSQYLMASAEARKQGYMAMQKKLIIALKRNSEAYVDAATAANRLNEIMRRINAKSPPPVP